MEREQGLSAEGQARRRFLKQAGTVAWASPMIVTMMSRAAHAQQPGDVCGTQDLNSLCNVAGLPCGTTMVCAPEGGIPTPGGNCTCQAL